MTSLLPARSHAWFVALALVGACSSGDGATPVRDAGADGLHDGAPVPPGDGDGAPPGLHDAGEPGPVVLKVGRLRSEYRVNPLGIDVARPRLDWLLESDVRGQRQTAYQVLVARSEEALSRDEGDLWDSGKVPSDASSQVEYGGAALRSRERAYWKVRVWDRDDVPSPYSAVAHWELGLLEDAELEAAWITRAVASAPDLSVAEWLWFPEGAPESSAPAGERFFRKSFDLPAGDVLSAEVQMSADNAFELYVNGVPMGGGDDWSTLGSFDIASALHAGKNVLAVRARNVDGPAGLLAGVRIALAGGNTVSFASDASWKAASSAEAGFEQAAFDDASWPAAQPTVSFGESPWGTLSAAGVPAYLRRAFALDKPVRSARLYATALGLYELWLNGQRVGDDHLTPGWTDYRKRVQVQTYDVTQLVQAGENALGAILADGWFNGKVGFRGRGDWFGTGPNRLRVQLEVEHPDGTRTVVESQGGAEGGFKASTGPLLAADLLDGETYDARLEHSGWSEPGFDDSGWQPAQAVVDDTPRALVSDVTDGVRVVRELPARTVREVAPGVFVFDLGQNMTGWERLRVQGARGARLRMRFSEVLNGDGTLYTTNLRGARATDVYVLRGGGPETYEPRFTTHGFRYVELSGDTVQLSEAPSLDTITGIVAHSGMDVTGSFDTSSPALDQLQSNILWGQRGNFVSVPTDCPQRDERLGWLGDAQMFVRTAAFNMDVASFFTKWMRDVADAQAENGAFSEVAPNPDWQVGTPAWGDAGLIVPWQIYLSYGDTRILAEHYDAMARWVRYIADANPNYLWLNQRGSNYGDWESDDSAQTDKDMLATAFYAQSVEIMMRSARLLGKESDAMTYEAQLQAIKQAFAAAYVDAQGVVKSGTQTAYALALRFGLVPEAQRASAVQHMVDDVAARKHITTGFVGVPHVLPALTLGGRSDVAYELLMVDTFPSWLYEVKMGATTVWERWDALLPDGSVTTDNPTMNSFNHYAFGAVGEWLYENVAGIRIDEQAPGYKHFFVTPQPGAGLSSARGSIDTIHGTIVSDWTVADGRFTLSLQVPVNTRAHVRLPYVHDVRESGEPVLPESDGSYRVESGRYTFTARLTDR